MVAPRRPVLRGGTGTSLSSPTGGGPTPQVARSPSGLRKGGAAVKHLARGALAHPRARASAQVALALVIFGVLVGVVLAQWSRLPDYEWRFDGGLLALAGVAVLTLYLIQGEAWRRMLRELGGELDTRTG